MKAIIMAGGEGTRLRPLTCACPKPMMRLMDKPVMEYTLKLLKTSGVKEAAVTLGYLPDRITDYFENGEGFGVKLRYYTEETPLGTAGGVKRAADFLDETFCVLSGDGVTDISLESALNFHKEKRALATMVLTRVPDPTSYGLVLTAPDGRICNFIEKPDRGGVVSDSVNTGIYILEPEVLSMIPDAPYDFGRDLFPEMARGGAALYGYVTGGYWCDIGDISAYLRVCRDALDGKINIEGLAPANKSGRISPGAEIASPCYIGENALVESGARVGAYSVIGENARLEAHSSTKRAVLLEGARLGRHASARGCVLARGAALGDGGSAFEDSVIGESASVGAKCEIAPGVGVWPSKNIGDGLRIGQNIVWGEPGAVCFAAGSIPVGEPSYATTIAQAYAARTRPRDVLLAREPSAVAAAAWHACAAGLIAQGARVFDAGVCTLAQLRYAVRLMKTDGALLAGASGLTPLTREGCTLSQGDQRAVCALISRQDYPRAFRGVSHPVAASGKSERAYVAHLASAFAADLDSAPRAAIHSQDQYLLSLAEQAFSRAGLRARCEWEEEQMELSEGEIGVWLISGGADARISCGRSRLTGVQMELLRAWTALERGEKRLITNARCTRAVSALAEAYGASAVCSGSAPEWESDMARTSEAQFALAKDGIFFALAALSALTNAALDVESWLAKMPAVTRSTRKVPINGAEHGAILRRLREATPDMRYEDGLSLRRENASAWFAPDEKSNECAIVTESVSAELAEELCDFCEKSLRAAIESAKKL